MPSESSTSPGQQFYTDLRLIREKNGLTPRDVFRATKLPLEFVELFEKTGLLNHPHYNRVYLRSFVKAYAQVVDVDESLALQALKQSWEGNYGGELAAQYLGYIRPQTPDQQPQAGEPSDRDERITEEPTHEPETSWSEIETEAGITPIGPPAYRRRLPNVTASLGGLPDWAKTAGLWIVAAAAVVAVIYLGILMLASEGRPVQESGNVDSVADTTGPAVSVPEPLLRDTMSINIVAASGKLEPVRVSVDGEEEVRYWVEEGDTLMLAATDSVVVQAYLDRLALVIDGHELPTGDRDQQNRLVYTRREILRYLRSIDPE